jgi:NAD(P)-dependent dehydrogenase (short-subunit alcohol dehydrogenase family)
MEAFEKFVLTNKVAIVTGSSRGIGKAIALGFAKAGADVVVLSRHFSEVEVTAKEIEQLGRKSLPLQVDVSKKEDVGRMVEKSMEKFGKIDILVNNAGTNISKKAENYTEEEWDYIISVNLKGVFLCSQAVGKVMIKQKSGKIINIASIMGKTARVGLAPYAATKGAVIGLTQALAVDWARHNIHVNAIGPGWVNTALSAPIRQNEKLYQDRINNILFKRFGEPEEMVGIALFLASESSSYVTGQTFFIDGGWLSL